MQRVTTSICLLAAGLCLSTLPALGQSADTAKRSINTKQQKIQVSSSAPAAEIKLQSQDERRITPGHVTWTEFASGEQIFVSGTPAPRHEPAGSQGQTTREGEAFRLALRKKLDWQNLSVEQRKMLAPVAVGPDQIDIESGVPINLVNFTWAYTPSYRGRDHVANDIFLNVEGDVVVAGTTFGSFIGGDPFGFSAILLTEVKGTNVDSQGWTENWEREARFTGGTAQDRYVTGRATVADLNGNTFTCGARSNGKYTVWLFDGDDGTTLSSRSFSIAGGTDAVATDIAVDPEGVVYVCGHYKNGSNDNRWFVAQHDPASDLDQGWINLFSTTQGKPTGGMEIDRLGNIYVAGRRSSQTYVVRLSPYDGLEDWSYTDTSTTSATVNDLALDFDGNPHTTGQDVTLGKWSTIKLDANTGSVFWRKVTTLGEAVDIEIDPITGLVYTVGSTDTIPFRIEQRAPSNGTRNWSTSYNTTGAATSLTLDRLGNPYVAGWYGSGVGTSFDVRKFNPVDGSQVWAVNRSPVASGMEFNTSLEPTGLVVDAGGSVYTSGWRRTGFAGGAKEFFLVKYSQPYVSIPQIATDTPNIRLEGRSIWDPTASDPLLFGFNETFRIFKFNISSILPNLSNSLADTLDLGIFGSVTGGVDFDLRNAEMEVKFAANATGGTFDTTITGPLAVAVPAESELVATQPFDITIGWAADEGGMEFIANAEPDFSAGFNGSLSAAVDFKLFAENGSGDEIFPEVNIVSGGASNIGINEYTFLGLDALPLPPAGIWYNFSRAPAPFSEFVVGKVRSPVLDAEGEYFPESSKFVSELSEKILDARINITNIISWTFTGIPTFASFSSPVENDSYQANITASLIQAYLNGVISIEQDLELDFTPYITLSFDDPSVNDITLDLLLNGSPGDPAYPSFQATYTYPAFPTSGELTISPTFGVRATLKNRSGLEFDAFAGFESISLDAALSAVDTDFISVDECFGCIEQDLLAPNLIPGVSSALNQGRITLLDTTSMEFDFPHEYQITPMRLFGDTSVQPQLIGSSRQVARMIIYDQRNPSVGQINNAAGGTEPMVLYGRKFFSDGNITAMIAHHGRTESLDTTRLNNQALLVQVPQRFYLLPGVARIWIEHNVNGISETIEFPIEYPVPNFQGLEEDIWAGDIRYATQGLTAIDGGTPANNDSFIARRDYYRNMRINLWNPGLTVGVMPAPADTMFPGFTGWETPALGVQPPGFPSLVWDGVPLARFRPSPNDGKFRSRLQLSLFDEPGFYTMQLCNPGPGGGQSRERTIEVPAPVPVITRLNTTSVRPGVNTGIIDFRVFGPRTVPFFDGYENEKYGNFNALSVVNIDGIEYPTEFNGAGFLKVNVPSAVFDTAGQLVVTVETPAMGTSYPERLLNGDGSVALEGLVASGGTSVGYTLEVAWPTPRLNSMSHPIVELGSPPIVPLLRDGVPPSDNMNVTLSGRNFAPGCLVFLDGFEIPSIRESQNIIRAEIRNQDVDEVGVFGIVVQNPSPNLRESNMILFQIILPAE